MKKGFSIVITSTSSGNSKSFFLSRKIFIFVISFVSVVAIVFVVSLVNYSRIYYQALETVILKRRNLEIEREFAKLQEIKENLKIAEMNNRKIKVLLGAEKTPEEVQPEINEVTTEYSKSLRTPQKKEENIPYLLPTIGHISRTYTAQHTGVDIAAPRFTPVVAAASGEVIATGWDGVYGNYVLIEHDVNYSTFYGHLYSVTVEPQVKLISGAIIGTVGSTGKSTSPHLHYEVRFQSVAVDPLGYLPFVLNIKE